MKTDPKSFYGYANRFKKKKSNIGPLRVDGKILHDPREITNALQEYYLSAFSLPDSTNDIGDKNEFYFDGLTEEYLHEEKNQRRRCKGSDSKVTIK